MIQRYSITSSSEKIQERFSVDVPDFYKPRFNAAPTQLLPVITNADPSGVSLFYWGTLPAWAGNKTPGEKVINIRVENLVEKPTLKKAMMQRRCIIPADGFYIWKKVGKKTLIPHRCVLQHHELFSIGGIWEEFEDESGQQVHTFMIFTTRPNDLVAPIFDRMPLILDKQSEKIWMDDSVGESDLSPLLEPYASVKMNIYTISSRINELSNDVASLIMPAPAADQFGNLTLFD